jgi:hypothetical protein
MKISIKDLEPGWETKLKEELGLPNDVILEIKKMIVDAYDEELLRLRKHKYTLEPEQFKYYHEFESANKKADFEYTKLLDEVQWRTLHYASLLNIPNSQWSRDFAMAISHNTSRRGDFDKEGNRTYRKKKLVKPKPKRKICKCKK